MVRRLNGGRVRYVWLVVDVLLLLSSGLILFYGLANRDLLQQILR